MILKSMGFMIYDKIHVCAVVLKKCDLSSKFSNQYSVNNKKIV